MKLLFLVRQEGALGHHRAFYDFLPYKYGPYSFTVDRDLRSLMDDGLVKGKSLGIHENSAEIALSAYLTLPPPLRHLIGKTVRRFYCRSDNQLVEFVYSRYPNHTILSELAAHRPSRAVAETAVYTLGYEGLSIDAFLHLLIRHGLSRVVDVRMNAVSRRFGFTKRRLTDLCQRIETEYVHSPKLGIPSNDRKNLSSFESYQRLFETYEKTILPREAGVIGQVARLMQEKPSVLICYEADVRYCHRGRLASVLASKTGLPVVHLGAANGESSKSPYNG